MDSSQSSSGLLPGFLSALNPFNPPAPARAEAEPSASQPPESSASQPVESSATQPTGSSAPQPPASQPQESEAKDASSAPRPRSPSTEGERDSRVSADSEGPPEAETSKGRPGDDSRKAKEEDSEFGHGVFAPAKAVSRSKGHSATVKRQDGVKTEWKGRYKREELIAISKTEAAQKRPTDIPAIFCKDTPGNLAEKAKAERAAKRQNDKEQQREQRERAQQRGQGPSVTARGPKGPEAGRGFNQPGLNGRAAEAYGSMGPGGDGILSQSRNDGILSAVPDPRMEGRGGHGRHERQQQQASRGQAQAGGPGGPGGPSEREKFANMTPEERHRMMMEEVERERAAFAAQRNAKKGGASSSTPGPESVRSAPAGNQEPAMPAGSDPAALDPAIVGASSVPPGQPPPMSGNIEAAGTTEGDMLGRLLLNEVSGGGSGIEGFDTEIPIPHVIPSEASPGKFTSSRAGRWFSKGSEAEDGAEGAGDSMMTDPLGFPDMSVRFRSFPLFVNKLDPRCLILKRHRSMQAFHGSLFPGFGDFSSAARPPSSSAQSSFAQPPQPPPNSSSTPFAQPPLAPQPPVPAAEPPIPTSAASKSAKPATGSPSVPSQDAGKVQEAVSSLDTQPGAFTAADISATAPQHLAPQTGFDPGASLLNSKDPVSKTEAPNAAPVEEQNALAKLLNLSAAQAPVSAPNQNPNEVQLPKPPAPLARPGNSLLSKLLSGAGAPMQGGPMPVVPDSPSLEEIERRMMSGQPLNTATAQPSQGKGGSRGPKGMPLPAGAGPSGLPAAGSSGGPLQGGQGFNPQAFFAQFGQGGQGPPGQPPMPFPMGAGPPPAGAPQQQMATHAVQNQGAPAGATPGPPLGGQAPGGGFDLNGFFKKFENAQNLPPMPPAAAQPSAWGVNNPK